MAGARSWRTDTDRALAQPLNHLFARGGVAAGGAAQRFTQRAGDDIDAPHHIAVFVGAAAVFADEADSVGVIDHHQRIVFIRRSQTPCRLAITPSIENTPSVAIST